MPWHYLVVLAILCRVVLLFSMPTLSDDIYRFLWDGHLIHKGISPLSYLPSDLIATDLSDGYLEGLFPLLNSPDYYTIYPPISQLIYYLSTIGELTIEHSVLLMKSLLLSFEILTLFFTYKLLRKFELAPKRLLIYALNPLIILEVMGNMHFEGVMICFLMMSIYLLTFKKFFLSGAALACSVGAKLLPLMFLPALLLWSYKKGNWKKLMLGLIFALMVLFVPFFFTLDIDKFLSSVDLYFQKFEFNASIYYVTRFLGKLLTGYNQIAIIGPFLSLCALGIILYRSYFAQFVKLKGLLPIFLLSFVTYLLFTTTVHPWYLSVPIALSVFYTRWWVIAWSFLITLSYSTYAHPDFKESMWIIFVEYLIVFLVFLFERNKFSLSKMEV